MFFSYSNFLFQILFRKFFEFINCNLFAVDELEFTDDSSDDEIKYYKKCLFSILHFSHLNFVVFVDEKQFSFRFLVVCRTDNSVDRSSVVSNRLPLSGNIHLQQFSFCFLFFWIDFWC